MRHLFRVMRRHDMTKKIDKDKYKDKDKDKRVTKKMNWDVMSMKALGGI